MHSRDVVNGACWVRLPLPASLATPYGGRAPERGGAMVGGAWGLPFSLPSANSQRTAGRWRSGVSERAWGAGGSCGHRTPVRTGFQCTRLHVCPAAQMREHAGASMAHVHVSARTLVTGVAPRPNLCSTGIPASVCVGVFLSPRPACHAPPPACKPGRSSHWFSLQGSQPRGPQGQAHPPGPGRSALMLACSGALHAAALPQASDATNLGAVRAQRPVLSRGGH